MYIEECGVRICVDQLTQWWVDNLFAPHEMVKTVTFIY